MFNTDYQHRWLDSLQPEDPSMPHGQQYGYGIAQLRFGPNALYFHGGEMPGYNSFMDYDPTNRPTLVVWTNLTTYSAISVWRHSFTTSSPRSRVGKLDDLYLMGLPRWKRHWGMR